MTMGIQIAALTLAALCLAIPPISANEKAAAAPTRMEIKPDGQLLLNGKPFFPLMLSPAPDLYRKAPDGRDGLRVLKEYGMNSCRVGMFGNRPWGKTTEKELQSYLDWMHEQGFVAALNLRELSVLAQPDTAKEKQMREFVQRYRMHPAVAAWKTMDEPQWGNVSIPGLRRAYEILHEIDPDHPAWMNHAPRGTREAVAKYCEWCDITGVDIYPVSIPMGKHSHLPNRDLSMVGDYVKWISQAVDGKKPIWMVLQVTWSGVKETKPTLRPSIEQERYMIYQAIITGASGILFFGSNVQLEGKDAELGFCWSYWEKVLGPIIKEIGVGSELYPVISAPRKPVAVKASGAEGIEFLAREVNGALYILAARREGTPEAAKVSFALPKGFGSRVEVLYEKRDLKASGGSFSDDFTPHAVHVYRIRP